jgi:hypothetical protein
VCVIMCLSVDMCVCNDVYYVIITY